MSANEPMDMDISPTSEIEVISDRDFLKWHQTDEPDGLSSFVFKDGGVVLALELPKLLVSI